MLSNRICFMANVYKDNLGISYTTTLRSIEYNILKSFKVLSGICFCRDGWSATCSATTLACKTSNKVHFSTSDARQGICELTNWRRLRLVRIDAVRVCVVAILSLWALQWVVTTQNSRHTKYQTGWIIMQTRCMQGWPGSIRHVGCLDQTLCLVGQIGWLDPTRWLLVSFSISW